MRVTPEAERAIKQGGRCRCYYLKTHFRTQTANQDIPFEVCFSCREDYQNGKICGYETFSKISG